MLEETTLANLASESLTHVHVEASKNMSASWVNICGRFCVYLCRHPKFLHLDLGACAVLAQSLRVLVRARAIWFNFVAQPPYADKLRWLMLL